LTRITGGPVLGVKLVTIASFRDVAVRIALRPADVARSRRVALPAAATLRLAEASRVGLLL